VPDHHVAGHPFLRFAAPTRITPAKLFILTLRAAIRLFWGPFGSSPHDECARTAALSHNTIDDTGLGRTSAGDMLDAFIAAL
jgi:hypothetical protein